VETHRLDETVGIAHALVAPLKESYIEVLVYFSEPGQELAAQRVLAFQVAVVVVRHARNVDESLDEVLGQLHEQPDRRYPDHVPGELVPHHPGHEAHLAPLDGTPPPLLRAPSASSPHSSNLDLPA